jgi:vacuolar-type H+-ATPase subunit E/Vma4
LKDIIEQIIEIDQLAFENKKKNDELLATKKQELENKLSQYSESMLDNAKRESEKILSQIAEANSNQPLQKTFTNNIEERYLQIEDKLVEIVFNKLFEVGPSDTFEVG